MADLPPSIGFDDEPVILLNYTILDDSLNSSKIPTTAASRVRTRSESSLLSSSGANKKKNKKTSVSSLSDASSYDLDGDRPLLSQEEANEQLSKKEPLSVVKVVSLKSLEEETKNQSLSVKTHSDGHSLPSSPIKSEQDTDSRVILLETELVARNNEIANLRRQLQEARSQTLHPQTQTTISESKSVDAMTTERQHEMTDSAISQRTTLHRLIEEQQVSSRLKSDNKELKLKVLTLESEVDKLHQQNLIQLQQLEQATTSLAAVSTAHSAAATKPRKKSFFGGLRRSGRKASMGGKNGSGSSIEQSPQLQHHSSSHLSLEGSFSEHDISTLLTRKADEGSPRLQRGMVDIDVEVLQTTLRLSMEGKSEVDRQLALLQEELKYQEERMEQFTENLVDKKKLEDVTVTLEKTQQSLQLASREKELLESENEGLKYELETLRSESDNLISSLKGKEVKAVLKEKQEMDFLRSENKALMSEVRTLISNSDVLETSLSQLKREMVTRDVKGHELKLKIKKLDNEKKALQREVASLKNELAQLHNTKPSQHLTEQKDLSLSGSYTKPSAQEPSLNASSSENILSSSSSSDQSHSVNRPPTHQKKSSWSATPIILIPENHDACHERTQSEDLNASQSSLQLVRTSSGGTKFVAMQVDLPRKESATKLTEKSFSVPSLDQTKMKRKNSDSTLGTFVNSVSSPLSPKPGVNSLVKMFESSSGKNSSEECEGISFSASVDNSLETSTEEDAKELSEVKPLLSKSLRTRRLSSSSSLKEEQERKKNEEELKMRKKREEEKRKQEQELKRKEELKEKQRKEQEIKDRQRKEEKLRKEEEKLRKEQEKQRRDQEAKDRREKQKREQETKEREKREKEIKERERREQEIKERERREQEIKERERLEQEAKEREKREQEAKERERREQEIKEKERREQERERLEQEAKERSKREKEAREKEKQEKEAKEKLEQEARRREQEAKEREQEIANKKIRDEEERRKRDELTADRSLTWPSKTEPAVSTTNTLPHGLKNTSADQPKRVSPTQSNSLAINKPRPPPTAAGKGRPQHTQIPNQSDNSLSGVVANLRSSWEKKSQTATVPPPSRAPLGKTVSIPVSMERSSSYNPPILSASQQASIRPLVKTGSGPLATIISSPSDAKKVPPLRKEESSPILQNAINRTEQVHLKPKAPVTRTLSGDNAKFGEVVLRERNSGHPSPRNNRPASLYVSTSSSAVASGTPPTSEKRLSSLITKLQVKESTPGSSSSPSAVHNSLTPSSANSSFVQNQSPVLPRYNSRTEPPPLNRPHSFYSGSPKPLQRAVSLASPLDRRTKKTMLLRWCQLMTQEYQNVAINNFGESFSNGLAFCALLHHFIPDKIPYSTLDHINQKKNFEIAFSVAESIGIPSLLDIDDMVEMAIPDWMSVMTYVSYIYNHFAKKDR